MIRSLTTHATHDTHSSADATLGRIDARAIFNDATRDLLTQRLRAVILLAGSLRPDAIQRAANRCLLMMPVDANHTVQTCWHDQLARLTDHLQVSHLPVRVLIDRHSGLPRHWPPHDPRLTVSIERDPFELRGTGGLLRDVTCAYDQHDYVLVADAAQLLFAPLWSVVHRLAQTPGDIRLLARGDGSPAGLMLLRCGPLRNLPEVGFVDFKEQGLPRLAQSHHVHVATWHDRPAGCDIATPGLSLRHAPGYLHVLRCRAMQQHHATSGRPTLPPWRPAFALIEPGASVSDRAVLHDAVVLAGGRVDDDAALVRCVVGPGGWVRAGRTRTDTWIADTQTASRRTPPTRA